MTSEDVINDVRRAGRDDYHTCWNSFQQSNKQWIDILTTAIHPKPGCWRKHYPPTVQGGQWVFLGITFNCVSTGILWVHWNNPGLLQPVKYWALSINSWSTSNHGIFPTPLVTQHSVCLIYERRLPNIANDLLVISAETDERFAEMRIQFRRLQRHNNLPLPASKLSCLTKPQNSPNINYMATTIAADNTVECWKASVVDAGTHWPSWLAWCKGWKSFVLSLHSLHWTEWPSCNDHTIVHCHWPCPLWGPSNSHHILVWTRGLVVLYICILLLSTILYVYVYLVFFLLFSGFFFVAFFLQYFDTVGWVFWPVKTVSHVTYTVLVGMLNHAQFNPNYHQYYYPAPLQVSDWNKARYSAYFFTVAISSSLLVTDYFHNYSYQSSPDEVVGSGSLHLQLIKFHHLQVKKRWNVKCQNKFISAISRKASQLRSTH